MIEYNVLGEFCSGISRRQFISDSGELVAGRLSAQSWAERKWRQRSETIYPGVQYLCGVMRGAVWPWLVYYLDGGKSAPRGSLWRKTLTARGFV